MLHLLLIKFDNCFQYIWHLNQFKFYALNPLIKLRFYVLIRHGHVKHPSQNIIHYHLKTEKL